MSLTKCQNCGCQDSFLTTPAPCPTPGGCPNPEPCSEVIDSQCVIYSGVPLLAGSTVVVDTNDTVSEALTNIVPLLPKFKVFRGLITQTGTSVPTITVLENTLGFNITANYSGVGQYGLLSGGTLDDAKTFYSFQLNNRNNTSANTLRAGKVSSNSFNIYSYAPGNVLTNGILLNCPFEILLYP
jgi:hypothetical protein